MTSQIAEGLWRWTAPHPEWTPDKDKPGGWGRMVGCVYYEPARTSTGPIVLIEPLEPPEGEERQYFRAALERDVERSGRPVVIALGNHFHVRDAADLRERLACELTAHPETIARLGIADAVPFARASWQGVDAIPLDSLDLGETAFFIRAHRALVFADAVVGTGHGRLAVVPQSWAGKGEAAALRYRADFRADLRRLLALEPEIVLPSHGEPVLSRGREALAAAIDGPSWGE
jgi:glyoxylase-like metal-dependent hydrolase (beta-lactamase superfamily II)